MNGSKAEECRAQCKHVDPQIHWGAVARYFWTFVLALAVPQLHVGCASTVNTLSNAASGRA